jgi:tetratricopeptide (TPR) repeat protein
MARIQWLIYAFVLIVAVAPAKGDDSDHSFEQFYRQQRQLYYEIPATEKKARTDLLHELQREANAAGHGPHTNAAFVWIAQEYSTQGNTDGAVSILTNVLELEKDNIMFRHVASFELGLAHSRKGDYKQAEQIWLSLVQDPTTSSSSIRTMAAEGIRSSRTIRKDWNGVIEIVTKELAEDLARKPVLLEARGQAAMELKQYKLASQDFNTVKTDFPDYLPERRMLYMDKCYLLAKYENWSENIEYLTEMEQVLQKYETSARNQEDVFAEVYQEYYTLGCGYEFMENEYSKRGVPLPIDAEQTRRRALDCYLAAIQGLKALPQEKRQHISFEAATSGAYVSAVDLFVKYGDRQSAVALIEEYLKTYPDFRGDRLIDAQQRLQRILTEGLDMRLDVDNRIREMGNVVSDTSGDAKTTASAYSEPESTTAPMSNRNGRSINEEQHNVARVGAWQYVVATSGSAVFVCLMIVIIRIWGRRQTKGIKSSRP